MEYKTLDKTVIQDGFLKIEKAKVSFSSFYKDEPIIAERYTVRRPRVIAVLLERKETGNLVFVEQFRYASVEHNPSGWTQEVVGGIVEENEEIRLCAFREVEEETGYRVSALQEISSFYPSFGFCDEFMILYYGLVAKEDKVYQGRGLEEEQEDIRVVEYSLNEALNLVQNGKIQDAKTMLAIQWRALQEINKQA